MSNEHTKLINDLNQISQNAQATFGGLSSEQLNWRPAPESWSVGQCFEHLIKTNEMFYGEMDKIIAGTRRNSFWESWSPLTSFGGKLLIKSLQNDGRKVKTSRATTPPSEVDPNIIEIFAAHQAELIGKIRQTANTDWRKTVVTSPFLKVMTYNLNDGFSIVVEHERRHFRQAERVLQAEAFPRSESTL